jgi:hypothetical protein
MQQFWDKRWGDLIALSLIVAGGVILIGCRDPLCHPLGEQLSGAGLLGLRLVSYRSAERGDANVAQARDLPGVRGSDRGD